MAVKDGAQRQGLLNEMRQKISEIDRLVLELKELGTGVPVVEKNTRSMLSIINILKVVISDVAEIEENKEVINE